MGICVSPHIAHIVIRFSTRCLIRVCVCVFVYMHVYVCTGLTWAANQPVGREGSAMPVAGALVWQTTVRAERSCDAGRQECARAEVHRSRMASQTPVLLGRWAGPRNVCAFAWLDSAPLHARAAGLWQTPHPAQSLPASGPHPRSCSCLSPMERVSCSQAIEEHFTPQSTVHTNRDQSYTNDSQAIPPQSMSIDAIFVPPLSLLHCHFIHAYGSGQGSKGTASRGVWWPGTARRRTGAASGAFLTWGALPTDTGAKASDAATIARANSAERMVAAGSFESEQKIGFGNSDGAKLNIGQYRSFHHVYVWNT
jgi:hypothetical protein